MARVFEGGVEINTLSRGTGIDHRVHVRLATTSTITIATALNPGDTIDGVTLVQDDRILVKNQSPSPEVTLVTTVADVAGSLSGTYFLLNTPGQGYYVWIDVDNGSTDPGTIASDLSGSGRVGIEVDISTGDTANTIAGLITTAVAAEADFTAANTPTADDITITNVANGNVDNTVDGADSPTGFSFSITNGGSVDIEHGIYICDATPYRADDLVAGDAASHIFVHVEEGTVNAHTAWVCKNVAGSDVVDTDALDWAQYALYDYLKGDLIIAGSDSTLEKVSKPNNTSLLQIDGSGNIMWTDKQDVMAGFDPKESVRFATLDAIIGTYSATGGTSGTGTFTSVDLTDVGDFDLDGNTVAVGDRILIKNQADPKQNGIYVVTVAGATGTIERAPDQDGANPVSNLSSGNFTFVELGATLAQTGWVTQGDGLLAINTDDIDWVQFNGATAVLAGPGIDKTGNKLSLDPDTVTIGTTVAGVASTADAALASVISSATAGQVLRSVGTAGDSATWGALDLANTNSVTGELPLNNGGTGLASGDYTNGDMLYYDGTVSTTELQTLAKPGTNGTLVFDISTGNAPTWTNDIFVDNILDPANETVAASFDAPASAVNYLQLTGTVTTDSPQISAVGTDANIGIDLLAKGTGCVNVLGNATQSGCVAFFEDTDNGTNAITLQAPAAVTTDRTWLLPLEDPTASDGYILQTDTSGQWSFVDPAGATPRGFVLVSAEITITNGPNAGYSNVAYFAWDESEYGAATAPKLVLYADNTSGGGGNRDILVRVLDSSLSVIGGPSTFSTDGIQTLTYTDPGADDYLIVQVQKSANGGSSPSIFGLQMELN